MKYRRLGDDRGLILPLALMAFIVLGALAAAILSIGGSEAQIASNHLRAVQAGFLAEAGLERAFDTLRTNASTKATATATLQNIISNEPLGGAGTFDVWYQQAGTNTFRVVSTGTAAIGGSQAIRRATMSTFFHSDDAILTDGSLTISGSTDVLSTNGACGNVHANENLTLNGGTNLQISGNATASGTYQEIGSPSIGGDHDTDPEPEKTVPVINPTDFLIVAKASLPANHIFQMMANGQVLDGSGALIETLTSGATSTCGWRFTSGPPAEWQFSGNGTPCDGTFYFEGNATVSSSPGSPANPWKTTLITAGNLDIAGKPIITANAAYTVYDTLFVAGIDVQINGTPSNGYNGLIAAHEQFSLSGNGSVNGFIIGENAPHTAGSPVEANTVSGNITLTYNCGSNPPLQGPLQILSWGL